MKCPNHITHEVAGYCCVCGSFYCQDCLTRHEGNLYCRKHYKPIAEQLGKDERLAAGRKRRSRHALVVHFLNGQQAQGVCRAMNLRDMGFHLETEDLNGNSTGESVRIRFEDVKCVCNVKSYDGNFDKNENYQEITSGGTEVFVEFRDGEVIEGRTMNLYNPDHPRFYLIPNDRSSNNINILVEQRAVGGVYSPEEYAERSQSETAQTAQTETQPTKDTAQLEQEESMGDFYFEQRNYPPAVEQYRLALNKYPDSPRIRRKIVVALINVGIGHVKSRDYPDALACMDKALEIDPDNPHAKKKADQLRKVIEKTQRRMKAYLDGSLVTEKKREH